MHETLNCHTNFFFQVQFLIWETRGSEVYDLRHIFMLNFWRFWGMLSIQISASECSEISWHSLTPLLSSREHNFTIIKIKQIVGFKLFKVLFIFESFRLKSPKLKTSVRWRLVHHFVDFSMTKFLSRFLRIFVANWDN